MKKGIAWLLLAAMLLGLAAGCGKQSPAAQTPREPEEKVMEQVRQGLAMRLSLTEEQAEDLVVTDARDYGDESIVRFAQTWRGVEIYGSSIVTTSEDETFAMGAYYDLSEAFGEDFDTLVTQAAAVPDWMEDYTAEDVTVLYDRDSLRPVIYITEDQTAVIARCFTAELHNGDEIRQLEMVTDLSGEILYDYRELSGMHGYRNVSVKGSMKNPCEIVEENGTYYAYNEEYNFYAAATIYEKAGDVDSLDYQVAKNGRMQIVWEESLVYCRDGKKWNSGKADMILRAMTSYYNVLDWFYQTFGYRGLDGRGGLSAILVVKDMGRTVAANDSNVMLLIQPDVLKAEEVLAHECTHTMFQMFTGTYGKTRNQTAALNEALADVFGCLYQEAKGDTSWIIGEELDDPDDAKNIPGTFKTMDDYQYDVDEDFAFDWLDECVHRIYKAMGKKLVSTKSRYDNAYIITNTMYRIWKNVFDKDSDTFGQVLYRSLRYMPADPNFYDFRVAFVQATRVMCGRKTAEAAGLQFDKAGIYQDLMGDIIKVISKQQNQKYLLAYCTEDYATIRAAFDQGYYTIPDIYGDGGNIWNCTCMLSEGLSLVFTFMSDYEDPDARPVYAAIDDLMYWSGGITGAELAQGLNMGMTYAEVAKVLDLTELEYAPEQRWIEPVYLVYGSAEGCALELFFVGTGEDDAILVSVNAIPVG